MDNTLPTNNQNDTQEKRSFKIISALSDEQKKNLLNGSLVMGGVITGGTLHAMASSTIESDEDTISEEGVSDEIVEVIGSKTDSISDDMTFLEAFTQARTEQGPGGLFHWNGNSYNTYYQEEWDSMTSIEQNEYAASVKDENIETEVETDIAATDEDGLDLNEYLSQPVAGGLDVNADGYVDAIAVDVNQDGYADAIAIDIDHDGQLDIVGKNLDGDIDLDIVIVEQGQGGVLDNSYMNNDSVIEMDQFDIDLDSDIDTDGDILDGISEAL